MDKKFRYRLSKNQKREIAQNLIDFLQKDANITEQTLWFISVWVTKNGSRRQACLDVWDIVLKNYLPTTRPILFRSCKRIGKNGKIASFTGRLRCAREFSRDRGSLIICDTEATLKVEEEFFNTGEYKNTFYPLVSVLKKAKESGGCGFSDFLLRFICEDEYIMRIRLGKMDSFRWKT